MLSYGVSANHELGDVALVSAGAPLSISPFQFQPQAQNESNP